MLRLYLVFFISVFTIACSSPRNGKLRLESGNGFVENGYVNEQPIAQVTGMGNYSLQRDSFVLDATSLVQIYSVGEILYNLADKDKRYFLQSDDIELFFSHSSKKGTEVAKKIVFSYAGDTSNLKKKGILFKWKNIESKIYNSMIFIPWHFLKMNVPQAGDTLQLDVAIGDNDDGYIQEKKIAWSARTEEELLDVGHYGQIVFSERNMISFGTSQKKSNNECFETALIDSLWTSQAPIKVSQSLLGHIKDRFDLSAEVKYRWSIYGIYLNIHVNDSRQKKLTLEKIPERNIFTDMGWIEDKIGNRVWEMDARKSFWAGGALKNQKEKATLKLPPGKYYVSYRTDESHAVDAWDSAPPKTPFYGIVVYKKIRHEKY